MGKWFSKFSTDISFRGNPWKATTLRNISVEFRFRKESSFETWHVLGYIEFLEQ